MEKSKLKFILASTSPRRKELIGHLKIPFTIMSKNIPEESNFTDPVKFSLEIAVQKGEAVFDEEVKKDARQNIFVVSADTIVCLGKKIYGKPSDKNEARVFLGELSGKTHSVFTAVAVKMFYQGKAYDFSFVEESKVSFMPISEELMTNYLSTNDSLDKAGAYGIQGASLSFISRVEGCYANVVGFPLSRFISESETFLSHHFPEASSWLKLFA